MVPLQLAQLLEDVVLVVVEAYLNLMPDMLKSGAFIAGVNPGGTSEEVGWLTQ